MFRSYFNYMNIRFISKKEKNYKFCLQFNKKYKELLLCSTCITATERGVDLRKKAVPSMLIVLEIRFFFITNLYIKCIEKILYDSL